MVHLLSTDLAGRPKGALHDYYKKREMCLKLFNSHLACPPFGLSLSKARLLKGCFDRLSMCGRKTEVFMVVFPFAEALQQTRNAPRPKGRRKKNRLNHRVGAVLRNQSGAALITALAMMAVMSILGSMLISTTISEVKISGNYRRAQEAFLAADRALEYAQTYVAGPLGNVDLCNAIDPKTGAPYMNAVRMGNSGLDDNTNTNSDYDPDKNLVRFVNSTPPPPGSGMDAGVFKANYYVISATGAFPLNAPNRARKELHAQVGTIVPK